MPCSPSACRGARSQKIFSGSPPANLPRREHGAGSRDAAQGAPAPALHRLAAAGDPARAGGRAPDPAARRARRGRRRAPAGAAGHRRARLVPVPAALRRRPLGRARRGTTCAGWSARRPRTTPARGPAGWRSRSTPRRTRRTSAGSPPRSRSCWTPREQAAEATGTGVGVVIAANRTRHPLDARTLARLAAQHAGRGVVGFGLSNDERRGRTDDFAPAFRIAARAGLLSVPHGGELGGPGNVRTCLDSLGADRVGHGVRSVEDPALLDRLAAAGTTLEVCPVSNVRLGVYATRRRRAAAAAARGRRRGGARGRRPAAVRRPAARAVRAGARASTASTTRRWPSWPAARCAARAHRTTCGPGCWPASTTGWPAPPARRA